jgi:hypothetical protein
MTDKPEPKDAKKTRPIIHLGMMGDGTEEQNLGERGDPAEQSTKMWWMRLSTRQPQGKNPDFRVR